MWIWATQLDVCCRNILTLHYFTLYEFGTTMQGQHHKSSDNLVLEQGFIVLGKKQCWPHSGIHSAQPSQCIMGFPLPLSVHHFTLIIVVHDKHPLSFQTGLQMAVPSNRGHIPLHILDVLPHLTNLIQFISSLVKMTKNKCDQWETHPNVQWDLQNRFEKHCPR